MVGNQAPVPIDNDSRNPCVGCGPENPIGLRLAFVQDGDSVATTLRVAPNHQGWPGRLHSGILYLAMLETTNWTVYAARGRVGLPSRTGALQSRRWVAIGEELRLVGRSTESSSTTLKITVTARDKSGADVASLDRDYLFPSRAEFLAKMGYKEIPPELDPLLPE
jgi:hypothetical protein